MFDTMHPDAWARPEFSIDAAELRLPASGGGLRLPASAWGHTYLDTRTALDRSLDTGVGLKASAKKDEVSLPQKAAEQQAIPLLIDLMSARGSAKKNKAVGSDGCPSEFWKYLSCVSMVVIFRLFLMRLLAMEDGRNVDSPH